MRYQKIRGIKRRLKSVELWRDYYCAMSLEDLMKNDGMYAKIKVSPWGVSRISLTNSRIPEPHGAIKQKIFSGLLDIYDSWKQKLDALGKPYCLALWINDPWFQKSEVVCSMGEKLNFYENTFYPSNVEIPFPVHQFKNEHQRIQNISWKSCLDEYVFSDDDLGSPEEWNSIAIYNEMKLSYVRQLKKPHRTEENTTGHGNSYFFKQGYVWIGLNSSRQFISGTQ
jgi:hypothetical protein